MGIGCGTSSTWAKPQCSMCTCTSHLFQFSTILNLWNRLGYLLIVASPINSNRVSKETKSASRMCLQQMQTARQNWRSIGHWKSTQAPCFQWQDWFTTRLQLSVTIVLFFSCHCSFPLLTIPLEHLMPKRGFRCSTPCMALFFSSTDIISFPA